MFPLLLLLGGAGLLFWGSRSNAAIPPRDAVVEPPPPPVLAPGDTVTVLINRPGAHMRAYSESNEITQEITNAFRVFGYRVIAVANGGRVTGSLNSYFRDFVVQTHAPNTRQIPLPPNLGTAGLTVANVVRARPMGM